MDDAGGQLGVREAEGSGRPNLRGGGPAAVEVADEVAGGDKVVVGAVKIIDVNEELLGELAAVADFAAVHFFQLQGIALILKPGQIGGAGGGQNAGQLGGEAGGVAAEATTHVAHQNGPAHVEADVLGILRRRPERPAEASAEIVLLLVPDRHHGRHAGRKRGAEVLEPVHAAGGSQFQVVVEQRFAGLGIGAVLVVANPGAVQHVFQQAAV